jgi:uncharacterized protein DUF5681
MIEAPPDYRVGYRRPPLHTRFKKGQSGNPEGARRHHRPDRRLAALLEEALDARMAGRPRRRVTRREAIVAALVEKSAGGDLRAVKLLLDLVPETELVDDRAGAAEAQTAREYLIRELDRLAAEEEETKAAAALGKLSP